MKLFKLDILINLMYVYFRGFKNTHRVSFFRERSGSEVGCLTRGFESHRRHCVVSLIKNIHFSLVLAQPRKTRPFKTERLLRGHKKSNKTKSKSSVVYSSNLV